MTATSDVLSSYEFALEQSEFVRPRVEYVNRAVAVRSLEAWLTASNPRAKNEPSRPEGIPVTVLELRAEAYTAVFAHRQTGDGR